MSKKEWIDIAVEALDKAYVPYSKFPVGACLVTKEGKTYQGINIENASYGLTNCAERTAIFKAVSEGEKAFSHLVVAGHTPEPIYKPCSFSRRTVEKNIFRGLYRNEKSKIIWPRYRSNGSVADSRSLRRR